MNVVVYVFDAEAMVTVALGTVTKFETGMIHIGFAAHRAFVTVRFLRKVALCPFGGFFKVHDLRRCPYL